MKRINLLTIFIATTIVLSPQASVGAQSLRPATPTLLISELQTGGLTDQHAEDGQKEFIELYNAGASALDLNGWKLEYLSAAHNGSGDPTRVLAELSGTIPATSFNLVSYDGYIANADFTFSNSSASSGALAKSGGHVRIVDNRGATVDLVTWGAGVAIGDWWQAPEIPAGMSIQRILPDEQDYTEGSVFRAPTVQMTPLRGARTRPGLPTDSGAQTHCTDLQLSEILPNPAGTDAGKEYIEVHNSATHITAMKGCSIRLGSGVAFALPDDRLAAGEYRAFYDGQTGITLPNATAQTVWLATDTDEHGITYADNLSDDEAWALIDGSWQPTKNPTPNMPNALPTVAPATDQGGAGDSTYPTSLPCPTGKERNIATNRCRNITLASSTIACREGQERNPETNRCRTVTSAPVSVLTPCKQGQERNIETNRCRSVLAATNELKACATGQERNPDTNRCRKISAAAAKNFSKVEDVSANTTTSNYRWWAAGLVVVGALGYGAYEWRHDIANGVCKVRNKWQVKAK